MLIEFLCPTIGYMDTTSAEKVEQYAHQNMIDAIKAEIKDTATYTGIEQLSLKVLDALYQVKRHFFILPGDEKYSYNNRALSIGESQTISQPFIVALMTEVLDIQPDDKVLEIGTGSGYQAAILAKLAKLAKKVYTVEIIKSLADKAQLTLQRLGFDNVYVLKGDGSKGWPEHAPYNKIIITAACEEIPPLLLQQLDYNGIMVVPIGKARQTQHLTVVYKDSDGKVSKKRLLEVVFVPFT